MFSNISNRPAAGGMHLPWLVLVLAGVMVLACTAIAQATIVHEFQSSFGSAGSAPGQFNHPTGVAVNSSTGLVPGAGDVYVLDTGNHRVERFSATGTFLGWFNGSGTYEVDEVEKKVEVGKAAPTGAVSGDSELIAVDDSSAVGDPSRGDVYVIDAGHNVIDKFSPIGEYIEQIKEPKEGPFSSSITGLAVDPAGSVWVSTNSGIVYSFTNAVVNQEVMPPIEVPGKLRAVDAEDNLYLYDAQSFLNNSKSSVEKATSSGKTLIQVFSESPQEEGAQFGLQLAVDTGGSEAYVDDRSSIEAVDLNGNPIESDREGAFVPSFGGGHLPENQFSQGSQGIAVNSTDHVVYASDVVSDDISVFEALALPTVTIASPTGQAPRGVVLNGMVDPEGKTVTSCVFEYDTRPYVQGEAAHGNTVACSPSAAGLGEGSSPLPVSATVTGLMPQTTYYYRLAATNSGGTVRSPGRELFTGPRVHGEWAVGVSATSATVMASIDPNGGDTSYYVEYGATSAYGSYAPLSPPGVDLGSGPGAQTVSAHIQGLVPASTYFYRVVAVQAGEAFGCDATIISNGECDVSFTTSNNPEPSAGGLIDRRSWEMVSPADKRGALIEAQTETGGQIQAADDGSAVTYIARGPSISSGAVGHTTYYQVYSKRNNSSNWTSTDLTLPHRLPEGEEAAIGGGSFAFEYRLFSPSLSSALVEPSLAGTPPLSSEVKERSLYLWNGELGDYSALVSPANTSSVIEPPTHEPGQWGLHILAATPDLSHVIFKTPVALVEPAVDEESPAVSCPQAESEKRVEPHCYESGGKVQWNLYEWGGGELHLVNILPNKTPAHGRENGFGIPGVRLAGVENIVGLGHGNVQRVLSNDGRRVAWTWGEPFTENDLKSYRGLYVRDMSEERTVRVGGASANYQTMNAQGTRIFYLENGELYEYEWELGAETGTTVDLTAKHEHGETNAGVRESVSDVSEDGSSVYFVAGGVLAPGGVLGEANLYWLHEAGGVWATTLVAVLAPEDQPSWFASVNSAPYLANVSSRVSPNGRFLAFMSQRPLTGYDNIDSVSGQRDEEVYLYDSATNRLVCASCNPSGERPTGVFDTQISELLVDRQGVWNEDKSQGFDVKTDHWLAGNIPGWDNLNNSSATYQPRYLSDNGRLFFDSPDALVPQDANGLEDVYEFEPESVGGCTSTSGSSAQVYVHELAGHTVDGCIGLVSSGTSGSESAFLDASENGDDVFFVTASKLVGSDYDSAYDVYDAHVCTTSVPCVTEPVAPPPCESGDSCKGPPSPQPALFGAPASATFNGVGNLKPAAAAATKVKPRSKAHKKHKKKKPHHKAKRARSRR